MTTRNVSAVLLAVMAVPLLLACGVSAVPTLAPPTATSKQPTQGSPTLEQPASGPTDLKLPVDADRNGVIDANDVVPIDANDDGVVDTKDVLLVMGAANRYWDANIQPLLDKAGIVTAADGSLPGNSKALIASNLSAAEQAELNTALYNYGIIGQQVNATLSQANKK